MRDVTPLENIDPRALGEQLKMARRACGMTQEAAAMALELVRTTIVAIEKGERRVTASELIEFSRLYKRPVSDLLRKNAFSEPLTPQFRAALPGTQFDRPLPEDKLIATCHELESRAEDYLLLEETLKSPLATDYPPEYPLEKSPASAEQFAEDVAQEERNRLGLGDAPITDLRALLEEAVGLRIFFYPMDANIAGLFAYNDRLGGCVGINSKQPWYRGNWSLAHEYGHFLTTRRIADVDAVKTGRWGKIRSERFADQFAINFLMPRTGINRRISEIETARGNLTIRDLVTLADYFGVSVQAMCLRLESLKRISSGTWDRLKTGDFKPDKARQTLGLLRPERRHSEWPVRYLLLAKAAFDNGDLSETQLARRLRTDIVSVREIMAELDTVVLAENDGDISVIPVDLSSAISA